MSRNYADMVDLKPFDYAQYKAPVEKNLARFLLKTKRAFYIAAKEVFKKALIGYADSLPEPVLGEPQNDNEKQMAWENAPAFMRIRDKFMTFCNFEREEHYAAWKIFLNELEHDPDHQATLMWLFEEVAEAILNGEIKPRTWMYPSERIWTEPRETKGGWKGREFAKYIKGDA